MGKVHTNTHHQGVAFAFHGETHTMWGVPPHCRNFLLRQSELGLRWVQMCIPGLNPTYI